MIRNVRSNRGGGRKRKRKRKSEREKKKTRVSTVTKYKKKKRKKEERQHCGSFHRARTFTEAKEKEVTTNVVVEAC